MPSAATKLLPPKARLKLLADQVATLQGQMQAAAVIPVLRIARCGHESCGCRLPAQIPSDCLVIELGCRLQIPQIELPRDEATYRSRSEKQGMPAPGSGLGPEGVRRTLALLNIIPR